MTIMTPFGVEIITLEKIKKLGLVKTDMSLSKLLELFYQDNIKIDLQREIVSSIGRQANNEQIYKFLAIEAFNGHYMEVVYQMFRTCLYKSKEDERFIKLRDKMLQHYNNEVMQKMFEYYTFRQQKQVIVKNDQQIIKPSLLIGDNIDTLRKIKEAQIQLIFTSPPYYNARLYSDYINYQQYLDSMQKTLEQCYRVLEDGRFLIINVSPVITKRAGREFESIRYPIHFDFHNILLKSGFYFVDEIIWIKPEYSVPNRIAGYLQTKKPLSYKPNCITESIMVYRKNSPFLLDKNIKKYDKTLKNNDDEIDTANCWYISPKSDKNHPAVFPEKLCEKVLKYYSYKGDVVCDPFAGSGTFGKVAKSMNRIPLLCEQNLEYAEKLKRSGFYEIR
ncbi:site-specific DNA-methyltransferase [Campylobacter lari]|uniref:DNA-methyltransferase n=1 Tax=Campylobacter lari TaxID=201 RepID=UPI0012CCF2F0|nr:site-specific DNA-methyltransferase [Campylobacter lari]EAI7252338.1 site-specific DNA-methyltransferase [Campylobacter lari]EAJ1270107.1 site-specific DNA-methyltransferase [Campylobacter lari]EAL0060446.1 site-specific DNA-methyltransferase [Campylobacter lari]ECL4969400.1 site-specific DNA-methyltransferase [Campylobacter lari]EHL5011079.1 site-specific DNA-methyltransferase [Campylobacter lari]